MKAGLDKKKIILAAADIAGEKGIANMSLQAVANALGVKAPSLYKHFGGGLDELNKELMLYGWSSLEKEIIKASVGKAKDDALTAIFYAYRNFVNGNKGLFEAMQWYNMYKSEEHLRATQGTVEVLFQVLEAYGLREEQKVHCVRMLRGFLQGFSSIEIHGGFGASVSLDASFEFALKTVLNGISDMRGGAAR